MLTQKSFVIDIDIRYVGDTDYENLASYPMQIRSDRLRCNAANTLSMVTRADVVRMYTSETIATTGAYRRMVETICDAMEIDAREIDADTVPTKFVRNRMPNVDNPDNNIDLFTSGYWMQTRVGKRGTRETCVGMRLDKDGQLTDNHETGVDIPANASFGLRPFGTMSITDVWHAIRPQLSDIIAREYRADSRHVRVTLRYVGSVDIRG